MKTYRLAKFKGYPYHLYRYDSRRDYYEQYLTYSDKWFRVSYLWTPPSGDSGVIIDYPEAEFALISQEIFDLL